MCSDSSMEVELSALLDRLTDEPTDQQIDMRVQREATLQLNEIEKEYIDF